MSTTTEITIDIPITAHMLTACLQQPSLLEKHLSEDNKQAINSFVFDQLADKDGAPSLAGFAVKSMSYDAVEKAGRFRLAFQINRRFCCADVEACANDYLDFSFDYVKETIEAKATYFQWNLDN